MHLNYETVGKRIRLLRKQQHLSQMELAEMVDKSPTYISLVENGQKGPSLETLVDVANVQKLLWTYCFLSFWNITRRLSGLNCQQSLTTAANMKSASS